MLKRELYLTAPGQDTALWCSVGYIGGGLTREEVHRTSQASDTYLDWERRASHDNGRTWSELEPIEGTVRQLPGGGIVDFPCSHQFDPYLQIAYQARMRRIWPGLEAYTFQWKDHDHPFNDHTFVVENGETEKLMRYEDGPDYDPDNPFDPEFCATNRGYVGNGMDFAGDGTAYFPVVCYRSGEEYQRNEAGVSLMRREPDTGEWLPSTRQHVSPETSSRGLLEPDVAVLKTGAILIACRGSNTDTTPGRKWFTVSTDGGKTLAKVEEFRYEDGSQFYSPSSIHRFVRSSRNGKLYWLANIAEEPPQGNSPRYPLFIAEIDEENAAVRKDSLLLVDDRGPDEPTRLQLSNFAVIENRETQGIEIYLTRIGEDPDHFWLGNVYRYVFEPPA